MTTVAIGTIRSDAVQNDSGRWSEAVHGGLNATDSSSDEDTSTFTLGMVR